MIVGANEHRHPTAGGIPINDLYQVAFDQGFPKTPNVHNLPNLSPHVVHAIRAALNADVTANADAPQR